MMRTNPCRPRSDAAMTRGSGLRGGGGSLRLTVVCRPTRGLDRHAAVVTPRCVAGRRSPVGEDGAGEVFKFAPSVPPSARRVSHGGMPAFGGVAVLLKKYFLLLLRMEARRCRPAPREIGEMAGRKLQQAHHLDRTVGGDRQPPLAFPGTEAAGESRAAVLELTCAQHACHARTESEPHRPERGCPPPSSTPVILMRAGALRD